jgi:DNA-binding LacI/PurR family transcriptional regulator
MKKNKEFSYVTRADVAKKAGVSVTIVSYVLNNNRYVDKDKRDRVLQAVKELNYTPNTIARALKGKGSKHIIFIVENTSNERFGVLVGEMDRFAYEKGYLVSLCENRNQPELIQSIISRRFDGVIISSISFRDEDIKEIVDAGIPVIVMLSRDYDAVEGVAKLDTGLYQGARDCVRCLYDKGRRDIIYIDRISSRNHFSDMSDYRYRGFVHQMQEFGLAYEGHMITGCSNEEQVRTKLYDYLKEHPVDAIIGRNDKMACIAMNAAIKKGIRVPEDIAVIGFDNSSVCRLVTPTLTSVKMQEENIAEAAIDMLYRMHTDKSIPETIKFSTELVVRHSTDSQVSDDK